MTDSEGGVRMWQYDELSRVSKIVEADLTGTFLLVTDVIGSAK
ncbi:hypothetical protein [Paenibacillus durus]|nr:hypothetical protein [Paenibacillus durus]